MHYDKLGDNIEISKMITAFTYKVKICPIEYKFVEPYFQLLSSVDEITDSGI